MPLWLVLAATLSASTAAPLALTHDNTHSAGTRQNDRVTVRLVAGAARWQPEGAHGGSLDVAAFGEEGTPLTIPAPLLRAVLSTTSARKRPAWLSSMALFITSAPSARHSATLMNGYFFSNSWATALNQVCEL